MGHTEESEDAPGERASEHDGVMETEQPAEGLGQRVRQSGQQWEALRGRDEP